VPIGNDVLMSGPAYGAEPAFYRPYAQSPQRTMRLAAPAPLAPFSSTSIPENFAPL
jgi:hypothetical protein